MKPQLFIAIWITLLLGNCISLAYAQSGSFNFLWSRVIGYSVSTFGTTGDLTADHIQLSEILVAGQGNITLLDGYGGNILARYEASSNITYNALAIGNLDTDSEKEMVVGSKDGGQLLLIKYNRDMNVLNVLWNKSYNVTSLQVCDLTNDTNNEILVGDLYGNLSVLFNNGSLFWTANLSEEINSIEGLDVSQDGIVDRILALTVTRVILLNMTGGIIWQAQLMSTPLKAIFGDVVGTSESEIIVKCQNLVNAFDSNGTLLWNSTAFISTSPSLFLFNFGGDSKAEILVGLNNGSWFLNGTDGTLLQTYFTGTGISSVGVSNVLGDTINYVIMGDFTNNLSFWSLDGFLLFSTLLTGPILNIILIDMNADNILDVLTATSDGTLYVLGLVYLDTNMLYMGIGIGAMIVVISLLIVLKVKKRSQFQPSQSQPTSQPIKFT